MFLGISTPIDHFVTLLLPPPRSPIQIIKRNVRGVEKRTRSAVGVDLSGLGSLSVSLLHQMLRCPTVFGKPGSTVLRRLTFGELLAAFDVPVQALPFTCPAREVDILTLDWQGLPFASVPPLKILHKAYETWQTPPYAQREDQLIPPFTWSLPEAMYAHGESFQVEAAYRQAVKADDAAAPVHLWNDRVWRLFPNAMVAIKPFQKRYPNQCPLDSLRNWLLLRWRTAVRRSLLRFLVQCHGPGWHASSSSEVKLDVKCGRDCMHKCTQADWWEWRGGSNLFFWRWAPEFISMARDGLPIWTYEDKLPRYHRPQCQEADPHMRAQVQAKLRNVLDKGYIDSGQVLSLTSYFAVPKGELDVRMVYDSTKSGLNSSIWVPTFSLPTVETLTDMLEGASWMSDLDMGEQFLNFPLDSALQPYCGIDVWPYLGTEAGKHTNWLRWNRCMMGLTSSPYIAIRGTHSAEEMVFGNRLDPLNPFRWTRV